MCKGVYVWKGEIKGHLTCLYCIPSLSTCTVTLSLPYLPSAYSHSLRSKAKAKAERKFKNIETFIGSIIVRLVFTSSPWAAVADYCCRTRKNLAGPRSEAFGYRCSSFPAQKVLWRVFRLSRLLDG